ncbi:MAG: hypothetical protein GXO43_05065 [Crenarchaeota archaeon]|nr:hypothetical protein [Thermoproteota archaeon]
MLPDQKELLELIVEKLNDGKTQSEIARQFGVSKVKISRIVNAGLKEGVFHRTYGVYTHCFLKPSWIAIATARNTGTFDLGEITPKPDLVYYSVYPITTFFMYFIRTTEPRIHGASIKTIELSRIVETLIPYEYPFSKRIRLEVCKKCVINDDVDDLIATTILKNIYLARYNIDLVTLWKQVGLTNYHSIKYHYYNHVINKIVLKRYIIRFPNSLRIILKISSPSMAKAVSAILMLYRERVITGIDVFDIVYQDPFRAYLVAWLDADNAWDKIYMIGLPSHVKIEIFPARLLYPVQG